MDTRQFTPQRQKILMGAACAGVLLVLGFSFAPGPELAQLSDDDDVLALVSEEDGRAPGVPRIQPSLDRPRRIPGARTDAAAELVVPESIDEPAPGKLPLAAESRELPGLLAAASRKPVVPTPYQERLELLKAEEEALRRHLSRRTDTGPALVPEPMPTVTVASLGSDSSSADVAQALAESNDPDLMQRVELTGRDTRPSRASGRADEGRGAWLSGSIEIE